MELNKFFERNPMPQLKDTSGLARYLIIAACFVIVVAGMKTAASIIVPFLLSLFIAILCIPFLSWLRQFNVPDALSILIVLVGVFLVGFFLLAIITNSLTDLNRNLPNYQARFLEMTNNFLNWLKMKGVDFPPEKINELINPSRVMKMASGMLTQLTGLLTNSFMIILTTIFILIEASGFTQKLYAAFKNPEDSMSLFKQITDSVNRYVGIKSIFSLLTGVLVGVWVWVIGVDYPILWGLVAFLLNYVPNIGSIIAAVPTVMLALIQLGVGPALLTTAGYTVINVLIGSILEPKFMGRGLGLSALIVFLSLIFWGWVFGPLGMLLSVPLTMFTKIALEYNPDTQWIAVLLGSPPVRGDATPSIEKTEEQN